MSSSTTWYTYNTPYAVAYISMPFNYNGYAGMDSCVDDDSLSDITVQSSQPKVQMGNTIGYECWECFDFYPMAELNEPEGASHRYKFRCYGCRKGLKTIFETK